MDHNAAPHETGWSVRQRIRRGEWTHPTGGMAPGYVQANLAILPRDLAADFQRFCALNPKPCPLLATSEPGDPSLPTLGKDIDIRTDIGTYRVWRDGVMVEEVHDITHLWRDDLVAFLLGCSHSFEEALLADGLKLRHFVSLHKEFDADDGEITRTRKLRRNVVEERYAPIIEAIYDGQTQVTMKAQIVYETGEVGVTERELRIIEV